ncbi:MAG TPA: acetate--CoA ligase family protein [Bacteroidales bacterium]|nr:acetate--CoA ligase family protein [Bacteroidales bacterium]HOU98912.1 acetate--CoA ligase family protein [Bacteroidales bacterium]
MNNFQLSKFYFYTGPSYYLSKPACVFNLNISNQSTIKTFEDEVYKFFPSIKNKKIPDVAGLFAETLMAILKMDIDLFISHYNISTDGNEYVIAVEYLDKGTTKAAAFLVSEWFNAIENNENFNFKTNYEALQARFDKSLFGGPTLYSLIEAGVKLDIPVFYLYEENQFQWGYGVKQLRGRSTTFHTDGIKDTEFTMFKDMVGDFLMMCGFPTPQGVNCFSEEEVVCEAKKLGFPIVVKPVAGHKGQGVTTGIMSEEEARKSFRQIVSLAEEQGVAFEGALVQQQIYGTDHRLLSVGGKFVAALERVPAYVEGNGKETIEMLIEKENAKEIRLDNARSPLCKIKIDDNLKDFLALQNKDLTYIPDAGEKITLRRVANISAGGVSINVTSKIHPDNVKLVENIARYFKVKCLGIDVLAQDISKSWREGNFGIIEINAGPGVFMHLAPAYGGSIDVPKHIMLSHFDTQTKGRIPIIAGNFIPQQMMEKIVSILNDEYKDLFVGTLSSEGVFFNNDYFFNNPEHDQNVKIILRNPDVNVAIFQHTKDDIYDYGILHQGADIIILDEPSYSEEKVLNEQLLKDGLIIVLENDKGILYRNDDELNRFTFYSDEDKYKVVAQIITDEMEQLLKKYHV